MKKATIFDFVQDPKNEGTNWQLSFLIDYLPLVDGMLDEVNQNLKNNKTNLVNNTELQDFFQKIAQPIPNTSGCLIDQLNVRGIDMSILKAYQQDDPYLKSLTLSDAVKIQNILRQLIRQNRKVVIADILLEDAEAGECYFNGYSNLKDGSLLLNDLLLDDYHNQYDIFKLNKVAKTFDSTELDFSLPKYNIAIIIYNDKYGNWSLQAQPGSKEVRLTFNKFEISHSVAFEEVDKLKQKYDFPHEFLGQVLNLARDEFNKNYWVNRENDDKSDLVKAIRLKKIIDNADWNSNLSLTARKESGSYYYQRHPDERNSLYLTMVPSHVLDAARELHTIRKKHEFDAEWDFSSTNYRKIVIRLSDHPNEDDYEYDLNYDNFTSYFNLEKIKKDGLSHAQMQYLNELIDDGKIEGNY